MHTLIITIITIIIKYLGLHTRERKSKQIDKQKQQQQQQKIHGLDG